LFFHFAEVKLQSGTRWRNGIFLISAGADSLKLLKELLEIIENK
jgi:hypothetical protein